MESPWASRTLLCIKFPWTPPILALNFVKPLCAFSTRPGTCDGGIFTYEKTTGHFLRTAAQDPLQTDNTAPGITAECSKLCSGEGSDCPAFAVDYAGQRCFKLDRNTQVRQSLN